MTCVRFLVGGQVQGVGFRASTRAEALRLGVNGYARNLRDGRVEVLADGSEEALDALQAWLLHGPPSARVSEVTRESSAEVPAGNFYVR